MDELVPLAQRHSLAIVEDSAQAHGATFADRPVGTFGLAGCFSFYPTKNMQAIEGGMITTGDPSLARRLRMLRNQGMEQRYHHEIVGTNARMSDVSAAIARSQLLRLPDLTQRRRTNATTLSELLADLPGLILPTAALGTRHVWHQYTVRVSPDLAHRDAFARDLELAGIGTGVHYPVPLHRSPAYTNPVDLPSTDAAAAQVLSLPVHPRLTSEQLHDVANAVTMLARAGERVA